MFYFCLYSGILYAENILRVAIPHHVGDMNPQGYGTNEMFAQNMIYEGLVKTNKEGKIIPSLAISWEIKDSGKTYIFTLRKDVKFSNGEEFNAHAVKKNFDSILKNRIRHSWAELPMIIESVNVQDDYSIILQLKRAYTPTLEELSLVRPFRFIAPSQIPDDLDLIKHTPKPIGTGPYKFVKSNLGVSDTFQKNENYWDKAKYNGIYFDTIFMRIITEPNSKLVALKTKQIDLIYGFDEIPIEIFHNVSQTKEFNVFSSPAISTTFMAINPKNEPLSSPIMRKAIVQGINKEVLIRAVFYNYQKIANFLFAPDMPYSNLVGFTPIQYNHTEAKKNIESLGYILGKDGFYSKGNKRLEFELMYIGNNPAQKAMAEILQSQFKDIGIFLKLSANDPTIYFNRQSSAMFDLSFSITWGIPYEPLIMLKSMRHGGHVSSILQYLPNKDEFYGKIEHVLKLLNTPLEKYTKELLTELYTLDVYIPLTYQTNKAIARKEIKGIKMGVQVFEIPFWEFYK